MKKLLVTLILSLVLGTTAISVPSYASGEDIELDEEYLIKSLEEEKAKEKESGDKHSTISSQSTEYTGGKTEISDNKVSTELTERNIASTPIADANEGPSINNSFITQAYWRAKIPNEIIPDRLKGYITQAINSFTIFAAIILVVALAAMGMGAMDEQQLKFSKKAVKVLITLILTMNLLFPIIYLGLWIAGQV